MPGRLPTLTNVGPLFLWPGISNPTSDLVQTTMDAMMNNGSTSYCGGNGSQWCVEASVFGSFGQLGLAATLLRRRRPIRKG